MPRTFRLIRMGEAHRLTQSGIMGWPEDILPGRHMQV